MLSNGKCICPKRFKVACPNVRFGLLCHLDRPVNTKKLVCIYFNCTKYLSSVFCSQGKLGSEPNKDSYVDIEETGSRLLGDVGKLMWLIILTILLILCVALTMKRWWFDYCHRPKYHKQLDDTTILYTGRDNGKEVTF